MPRPLLLIHGYSANRLDFTPLCKALRDKGYATTDLNVANYISLNNEITIKDIAEGMDRALRLNSVLKDPNQDFDVIVHSTGMLVIRSWLTNYGASVEKNTRLKRVKHIVGLAPATWGSPQAQKGRTLLGAFVKGNKTPGPDFMDAGDQVLDGLELGSRFTWDLAHADLLAVPPYYGTGSETPWVSVFIGNEPYGGTASIANDPGTDGTVRWSGCGLNTRKITIDLTRLPNETDTESARRFEMTPWADLKRLYVPMIPVDKRNHATIVSDPDPEMVERVVNFLAVRNEADFNTWIDEAKTWSEPAKEPMLRDSGGAAGLSADIKQALSHLFGANAKPIEGWQQFVIRARDERGDPVTDYMLEVLHTVTNASGKEEWQTFAEMDTDVHAYRTDPSYRCFHVQLPSGITSSKIRVRISASTGTELMAYQGYSSDVGASTTMTETTEPVELDVEGLGNNSETLFHAFTTTLIEIILNREPLPLNSATRIFTLGNPVFPEDNKPAAS